MQEQTLPFDKPAFRQPNTPVSDDTREARRAGLDAVTPKIGKRHRLILGVLAKESAMTARGVLRVLIAAGHLPASAERNATSPRLCELAKAGYVDTCGKKEDNGVMSTIWRITQKGREFLKA